MNLAIENKLKEHNLKIGAIVITHGHLDHTFSLISRIDDFVETDCYVHEADRDLLSFPERAMGPQSQALVNELKASSGGNVDFSEPRNTYRVFVRKLRSCQMTYGSCRVMGMRQQ